ncbi:tryptophan synthase beta subunit-like PLP-dependent enzyme [Aspergillus pseudoustus]|uniref:Tryptophan synthase beta subunit-like PLP-dependent enzyme n=1 Tax=Aspergillus pseudoustus TaxID=1810923 RepID=A0ABR4KZB8_9EURO
MGSITATTTMPSSIYAEPPQPQPQLQQEAPTTQPPKSQSQTASAYKTPWIRTPLIKSTALSTLAGCQILLKLENTQPSGSFKSRAMGAQILSHLHNPANAGKRVHFFASSGGNAGLAAVCAARTLGYPCTVVVPVSTKPLMVEKLVKAGAKSVVRFGETFAEAGEYMRDVVMKEDEEEDGEKGEGEVVKIALHPFDNEAIWEGNSTLIDELVQQVPAFVGEEEEDSGRVLPVDAIVCSVGGGGLLNGLVMGLERRRRQLGKEKKRVTSTAKQAKPTHVLAVETRGTDSLAAAVAKGSLVSLPKITSQATSLGAIRVSERTLQYALHPPEGVKVHSTVLSDAEAARGVLRLVDDERLLVELACGVCVEAAIGDASGTVKTTKKRKREVDEGYGDDRLSAGENEEELVDELKTESLPLQSRLKELVPDLGPQSRVVIVVCGGSNVTVDAAVEWRKMLQEGWGAEN